MVGRESYILFFSDKSNNIPIWTLQINDLELIAGMLAAGMGIMADLNDYYLDSDADVSDFRLSNGISEEDLNENSIDKLSPNQYGIWMNSSQRFKYNLYGFRTPRFLQGVITICNNFGVDFRNYVYGLPFDMYGNLEVLSGYVMNPYQYAQDAPDLNDIEEEEADDENITDPWSDKDDNNYEPPTLD